MRNKVLVLGVDGLDPRLTKKYMEKGLMPNFSEFKKRGSARDDLVMLGAMPTITPPMWTTLATGAYAGTHGVTCFWNPHPTKLDTVVYAFDSSNCKAEQLWNVFAENGRKTLVWHWPGSSWPPTSDSPNLHVVDGTQPSNINIAVGTAEWGQWYIADESVEYEDIVEIEADESGAGCVISDLEVEVEDDVNYNNALDISLKAKEMKNNMMDGYAGEYASAKLPFRENISKLPLKPAKGWANAPEDAKEFAFPISGGLERRVALVTKSDNDVYDTVAIYKSKKAEEPLVVLKDTSVVVNNIMDTVIKKGKRVDVVRQFKLVEVAPDGAMVSLYVGNAMEANNDMLFHPKSILQDIRQNVGELRSVTMLLGNTERVCYNILLPFWHAYTEWQAKCLNYMIENKEYEVVFSHLHNVDIIGHAFWEYAKHRPEKGEYDEAIYQGAMEDAYIDTDKYLGQFMHLLDKDWDIIITSDHGLICSEEEEMVVGLGDPFGVNCGVMREFGFTVMVKDENGEDTNEIDWSKTVAVAQRGNHIYINLKDKYEYGIVDKADQYELERKIIDALYSYRLHGKRVVSLAVRAKEAIHFGMAGHNCGDIIYFLEEGFNRVHGDSISTFYGYADTSVSPIFMAAGPNIKKGFTTERVIREVDVAPTVAVLGGVRMPAQCEGAPVYQILED